MKIISSSLVFFALLLVGCQNNKPDSADLEKSQVSVVPDITEKLPSATIYEVNIRQYTPEGDFAAFERHIPRLKELGVDILWFMPIFPISETKRKGSMGSYYAVSNYREVNPEFGDLEGFKRLVDTLQQHGFMVILDWVPNHTGWDHIWISEHPEWYSQNSAADTIIHPAGTDWYDVADLNYDNAELREAMIGDLLFWVTEVGIDGYRMDVASEVPDDFWAQASQKLKEVKPDIFMLAEAAHPPHRNEGHFQTSYGWDLLHTMNKIGKGELPASAIWDYLKRDSSAYSKGWHMTFTTNHDENSWQGTVFERYGDMHKNFFVLASTLHGMPLVYSGQEAGLNKRLRFFEKDTIDWTNDNYGDFYPSILKLKKKHPALYNGDHGGTPIRISSSDNVVAFYREKEEDKVVVAINLSDSEGSWAGADMLEGLKPVFEDPQQLVTTEKVAPGSYQIWVK